MRLGKVLEREELAMENGWMDEWPAMLREGND